MLTRNFFRPLGSRCLVYDEGVSKTYKVATLVMYLLVATIADLQQMSEGLRLELAGNAPWAWEADP